MVKIWYNFVAKEIFHPIVYGDLAYKQSLVKTAMNLIQFGSKLVKHLCQCRYDLLIIERQYGVCLALLKLCTDFF